MEEGERSSSRKPKRVILNLGRKLENQGETLVGKIFTGKNLNVPTVVSMIKEGWQLDEELEVHELDRNELIFLFRFTNCSDYARILKGRPWSRQVQLLNLQIWEDYMVLKDVDFCYAPFWLQFHGLPLEAFEGSNAKILGDAVGETMMYERPMVEGKLVRSFIRVRSLLRLDAPLTTGLEGKDPVWATVRYERLQNFQTGEGDEYECGSWMSTHAVRTYEDILEVCKEDLLEAKLTDKKNQTYHIGRNSSPAGEDFQSVRRRQGRDASHRIVGHGSGIDRTPRDPTRQNIAQATEGLQQNIAASTGTGQLVNDDGFSANVAIHI